MFYACLNEFGACALLCRQILLGSVENAVIAVRRKLRFGGGFVPKLEYQVVDLAIHG